MLCVCACMHGLLNQTVTVRLCVVSRVDLRLVYSEVLNRSRHLSRVGTRSQAPRAVLRENGERRCVLARCVVNSWLIEQGLPLLQPSCCSGMTESSLVMKSATGNLVCHSFF